MRSSNVCESQFLLAAIKSAYILCWGWVSVCGIDCDGEKPSKAELLGKESSVMQVEKSYRVQKATVHTPEYLGLPEGIWAQEGGFLRAGEDIVIGLVDTGIDPTHPSFSATGQSPYRPLRSYRGKCEVAPEFPLGSCNGKIVGAQHFAAAASKDGMFNASLYFASPLDGDGHGRFVLKSWEFYQMQRKMCQGWKILDS
jgi:subtilisin family serine protease